MIRPPRTDFWRVGVAPVSITTLTEPGALAAQRDHVTWLPDPGPWRYLADPFALRHGDITHVFVEAFDYRTKHGFIEHHELGPGLVWLGKRVALTRSFHLSYPFLVEENGEVFMVPESQQNGEIALYRARNFPGDWTRETSLLTDIPGAEASVLRYRGQWWMFFTIVGAGARDQRELHVAHAGNLTGPWELHHRNPVLVDRSGARPGGTPFVGADGLVRLPVQDCSRTYGGAIRLLRFNVLTPDEIDVEHQAVRLTGDLVSDTYRDGLHTLSGCQNITFFDVKRIARPWGRYAIDLSRRMKRLIPFGHATRSPA